MARKKKAPKKRKMTPEGMRQKYLQNTGGWQDFCQRIKKHEKLGLPKKEAIDAAGEELGLLEPKEIEQKYRDSESVRVLRTDNSSYMKVFNELPAVNVDPVDEMQWVLEHPAMVRAEVEDIQLTADDIREAPSRGTASLLSYAVINKEDFYKRTLDIRVKISQKTMEGEDAEIEVKRDLTLPEAERLLRKATEGRRKTG